jgi:hypothetical protein
MTETTPAEEVEAAVEDEEETAPSPFAHTPVDTTGLADPVPEDPALVESRRAGLQAAIDELEGNAPRGSSGLVFGDRPKDEVLADLKASLAELTPDEPAAVEAAEEAAPAEAPAEEAPPA